MRRDKEYVGKRTMGIEVQGSRRRGRPKKRWADCVKDDLRERRCTTELLALSRAFPNYIDPT